ncbi:MAG TPA: hypothetical protein VF271_05945 [Rhodanobacteraceae bacterium]
MNITRLTRTPWTASPHWMRPLFAVGGLFFLAIATICYFALGGVDGVLAATVLISVFDAFLWAAVLPNTLALKVHARTTCLPRSGREAGFSVLWYVALSLVLPALVIGWPSGVALTCLLMLVIGAGVGFLYTMLPAYLGFLIILWPSLSTWLPPLPTPFSPGFVPFALKLDALIVLVACLRWYQVQHLKPAQIQGVSRPYLLIFNRCLRGMLEREAGLASTSHVKSRFDPALASVRADRWQRQPDLAHTGPAHPLRSLRLALGPAWQPQALTERLRLPPKTWAIIGGGLLVMYLVFNQQHQLTDLIANRRASSSGVFSTGLITLLVVIVFTVHRKLRVLWRQSNTQLPLLALLPGLGDRAQIKRRLLCAAASFPLKALLALWVLIVALAIWVRLDALAIGFLTLTTLAWVGMALVAVTRVMAGMEPAHGDGFIWFAYPLCGLLTVVTQGLVFDGQLGHTDTAGLVMTLLWAALFLALAQMGRQAWRRLARQPHPFMPPCA